MTVLVYEFWYGKSNVAPAPAKIVVIGSEDTFFKMNILICSEPVFWIRTFFPDPDRTFFRSPDTYPDRLKNPEDPIRKIRIRIYEKKGQKLLVQVEFCLFHIYYLAV